MAIIDKDKIINNLEDGIDIKELDEDYSIYDYQIDD